MVIGYGRARNLMRRGDWKIRVSTLGDSVDKITLFHPNKRTEHTMRLDSGRKLMRECVVSERLDSRTAILSYNGTKVETEEPQWFASTKWAPEDAMAAAAKQGVTLTAEQAVAWWKRNERRFQNLLVQYGTDILAEMGFEEADSDGQG